MKKAFITGTTGQDGSYLVELLLEKGYEVHSLKRRASSFNTQRLDHLFEDVQDQPRFRLHYGDLTDSSNLTRLLSDIQPDEIYNLGAQSRADVVRALEATGFECRPIVAGNFARKEIMKYFNYEIHGDLPHADYLDTRGLFVGNHHYPVDDAIEALANFKVA